ncbi:GAF and ANTAR domain-containing protein [Pseudonocardia sp. KRD291]|uniref:GAF and ANTAR domain-containing protein n=1 Tax=Pseudonocardia sp. KRD291 TaxID=2792007 RepID=UPI001C4A3F47|nr:GAF and ANTAR domain-containing protein [Pseudonocardia sp. KRD291]MBW0104377.1 GAF and ANTAR domain-containing protein [Pseudonocardia sp. KRD291]
MHPNQHDELVASLAGAARNLINAGSLNSLDDVLVQVVQCAVQTVPNTDAAGISLATEERIESRAPFNDSVLKLDSLQVELGQGPCLRALADPPLGGVVVVDDLSGADADRWPRFATQAEIYGYRAICSTQLSANGGPHAALNLYSHTANAFDSHARTVAGLFGVQAALLLYGAEHAANLGAALGSRDMIGQAKGILMERFDVDGDQAFQMLVRSSQDTNVKLVDVARWLVTERGAARLSKASKP